MSAPITFGSWCSGIEAASEAWLPLGWSCAYVAEIEPFPCAYLHQRHGAGRPRYMPKPEDAEKKEDRSRRAAMIRQNNKLPVDGRLTNFGDLSQVRAADLPRVDLIAAGFPCQDFSIAGLRASLSGGRGSLSIIGVRLLLEAADLGLVRGAVLEQVPDVLNTADNAWGNILGALVGSDDALKGLPNAKPGEPELYGKWPSAGMVAGPRARIAWRILDAQHFRLAQRRERVWAVVDFGDGPDPAAVLFERKGMPGHPSPGPETQEGIAGAASQGAGGGRASRAGAQRRSAFGGNNTSGPIDVATARTASHTASHTASGRQDFESETFITEVSAEIAPSLRAQAQAQAQASHRTDSDVYVAEIAPTISAQIGEQTGQDAANGLRIAEAMVAHSLRGEGFDASEDGTGRGTPIVPVAYSIMPQNSGKDYKAREVDVAQPVMAAGPAGGNQGGDYIVQPVAFRTTGNDGAYETGDVVGALTQASDPNSHVIAFSCKDYGADAGPIAPTMCAMGHADSHANAGGQLAVAFSLRGREGGAMPEVEADDLSPSLRAADGGSTRPFVATEDPVPPLMARSSRGGAQTLPPGHQTDGHMLADTRTMAVRRITVVEAEILQGFPPNATLIDWPSANRKGEDLAETIAYLVGHGFTPERAAELAQTPDGPRYKSIGNSWPVTVPRWLGRRIQAIWKARAA